MRTLVLGAGVSGLAAAGLAARSKHDVVGFDESPSAARGARDRGFRFESGSWSSKMLESVDLVVTSPGIPEHHVMIQDVLSAGLPLVSELEFAAGHTNAPLLAVTGTNGKTSAVTAATAMLKASGARVCAAGNIGTALSDVVDEQWDVLVVEASSFQLRFTTAFHPKGAAILNVTPDHLDWHGSYDAYMDAKRRIAVNQTSEDELVFGADDEGARVAALAGEAHRTPVSGTAVPDGGAGVVDGRLSFHGSSVPAPDLGPDFLADLAAAAVLAAFQGATTEAIGRAVEQFRPGPHRRSLVGRWGGVTWIDDSKATNPHAAVAAAASYQSVILIAGGRNKGLDLSPMADMPTVRRVITIGESGAAIARLHPGRSIPAESLAEAIEVADAAAEPGDTVLLAPGCASFDMFASYADRGDRFADLVRTRKGADGN